MCGFFFIKKKIAQKFNIKKLNESADLIAHRGPDGSKTFYNNDIFVKFYRLSIQDLSDNGMQPMMSRSKNIMLVFNGEIYNFKKLKKYLKGKPLNSDSDTEVLLNLYEEMGVKIFDHLRGMFSLLIYDLQTKKILVARDQFGIKPLYVHDCNKFIIFSSEIKPILNYLKKTNFNYHTIAEFLLLGKQDHHNTTFFNNIDSVKPSHYYKYTANGIIKKKYWSIFSNKYKKQNEKKTIDELYNLINSKVDDYLISDRKIGVFMSSGIDSTSLASLISNKAKYQIDSFTYDFKNNHNLGESNLAKLNAKKIGINNHKIFLTSNDVIDQFDKLSITMESPFTSIRLFAVKKLYELANKKKYNVILEGAGGDEILGGYSYNYLPYLMDKNKDPRKIINSLLRFSKNSQKNTSTEFLNRIITLTLQGASTTDATPFVDVDVFNKGFLNNHLSEKFYELDVKNITNFFKMNNLQKSQIQDIQSIKLPRNLKFTDRLSMSSSIETRLPFLDIDVAKFCFNLQNEFKLKNGINRWIMKKVLEKISKNLKFQKNKKSIADPQSQWLKTDLKDYFLDNIGSRDFKNLGIFNQKYIIKKFNEFIKNKSSESSFQYFQILSTYRFIKTFKN
jgi:asparagine synthase (glutamine-hydrolysing)